MLTEMRQAALRAGDPHAVAYMHYAVALMEASNGRTREARRHLNLTDSLIQAYPNAWLEQLNLIAISFSISSSPIIAQLRASSVRERCCISRALSNAH